MTVLFFVALAESQTTVPVIRDDFNRASTSDVAGSKKWVQPTNAPSPSAIQINYDSTASFRGGTRGQEAWDTLYQSRLRAGVILKNRKMPTYQEESMFIYLLDSKDYNNCHGYAVDIIDNNFQSKWSHFDIYKIGPNPFSGTVIASGDDTLAIGDTLLFGIDNFSQFVKFDIWHGPGYTYNKKHFNITVADYTYDLFLNPYYIWLRGADYKFSYAYDSTQIYKFDNFMIGADARLHIPTTAPNPVISSFSYIPGGGVDSLTPFRWQVSAVDTFKINKIVLVQGGVRYDSLWSGNGLSQSRRIVRWTSKATPVSKSGLSFSGYVIVYDDSGKSTQSATKTFTSTSVGKPWVISYYPWWFENVYTPSQLPYKYMTHVIDFDAFYRGYWDGVSPNVRLDTIPYFYWGYKNDPGFNHRPWRDTLIAKSHAAGIKALAGYGFYQQWQVFELGDSIIRVWAHHISDTLKRYGYDGLALDLEPEPDGAVKLQWQSVIQTLRDTFDTWTPNKGILFSAPTGYTNNPGNGFNYPDNLELCDRIAPQEYDQSGFWNFGAGYNSPIYPPNTSVAPWVGYNGGNDSSLLAGWIASVNYRSRLLFGMPLYGRTFHGVSQPNAQPQNLYNFVRYDSVLNVQLADVHSTYVFDNRTKVPYVSNPTSLYWTTYENVQALQLKVDYAGSIGLGGVMTFDLGDGALITGIPPGHTLNELQEAVYNEAQGVFNVNDRTLRYKLPIWTFKAKLYHSTRSLNGTAVADTNNLNNTADTSNHGLNNLSFRLDSILFTFKLIMDSIGISTSGVTASNLPNQYLTGFKTMGSLRTDSVIEGTFLYFTNARARAALSVIAPLAYNSSSGLFSLDTTTLYTGLATLYQNSLKENKLPTGGAVKQYLNGFRQFVLANSDSMAEGVTNLFFTNARARAAFSAISPITLSAGAIGLDTATANISAVSKFQIRYANSMIGPSVLGTLISGFGVDSTRMLRGDQKWITVKHYHFPISSTSDTVIIIDASITTVNVAMAQANWGYYGSGAKSNSGAIILEIQAGQFIVTWSDRNQPGGTQVTVSLMERN